MVYHLKWAWPNLESFLRKVKHQRGTLAGLKKAASDGVDRPQEPSSEDWEQPRGAESQRENRPRSYSCKEMDPANNQWAWKRLPSVRWESQPWPATLTSSWWAPGKWPSSVGPRILMYRNWEIISGCSKLLNMWVLCYAQKCIYQLPSLLPISVEEESHTLHVQKELWISFHPPTLFPLCHKLCSGLKTSRSLGNHSFPQNPPTIH